MKRLNKDNNRRIGFEIEMTMYAFCVVCFLYGAAMAFINLGGI